MGNLLDKLYTPKQLAERHVLSLVKQWQERSRGRLIFFQVGKKIMYSESHINDYLALCEQEARNSIQLEKKLHKEGNGYKKQADSVSIKGGKFSYLCEKFNCFSISNYTINSLENQQICSINVTISCDKNFVVTEVIK